MSGGTAQPELHAVLFDLDGVLIDTETAVLGLWRRVAAQRAVTVSGRALRDHVLGCTPEHSVQALFGHCPQPDRTAILHEIGMAEPALDFQVMPGASSLLNSLSEADVPLALVTGASRERVARVCELLPELGRFRTAVTWGEPLRGKPHPDPYLLAAARLGIAPEQCVVLEDTSAGIRAATAAGAFGIGVANAADARQLRISGAAMVVSSLAEISVRTPEQGHGHGAELVVAGTVIPLGTAISS
jgi:HAD superfamily hydrolase (TIGR01509 family)